MCGIDLLWRRWLCWAYYDCAGQELGVGTLPLAATTVGIFLGPALCRQGWRRPAAASTWICRSVCTPLAQSWAPLALKSTGRTHAVRPIFVSSCEATSNESPHHQSSIVGCKLVHCMLQGVLGGLAVTCAVFDILWHSQRSGACLCSSAACTCEMLVFGLLTIQQAATAMYNQCKTIHKRQSAAAIHAPGAVPPWHSHSAVTPWGDSVTLTGNHQGLRLAIGLPMTLSR